MRQNPAPVQVWSFALLLAARGCATDARAAGSLQLNLDHFFQAKVGAAIVSDPRTGRVLAVWNQQAAFNEAYTPGSTAKVVVGAAAIEEGIISPSDRIMCRRLPQLLGQPYHCSHPPSAQAFDLDDALANSCNYFFSELGARLSSAALAHWYSVFGFGTEDGSPGEVQIPGKPRERALAALGEQGVTVTPAQLLLAYSGLAMHGNVFRLITPGQRKAPSLHRVISIRRSTLAVLNRGLRDCVEWGSCRAASIPGMGVAGKTGTAPALDGSRVTHAWFVGYAPANEPEVAIVIFLRRGTGGADAAPIAAGIFREYFALKSHTR